MKTLASSKTRSQGTNDIDQTGGCRLRHNTGSGLPLKALTKDSTEIVKAIRMMKGLSP